MASGTLALLTICAVAPKGLMTYGLSRPKAVRGFGFERGPLELLIC